MVLSRSTEKGGDDAMGARGLTIRMDVSAEVLRRLAGREVRRSAAARMYEITNALEGLDGRRRRGWRAWNAKRFAIAVVRYNAGPGRLAGP